MDEYIKREDILMAYEEEQRRTGPWRFETLIESVPSADVPRCGMVGGLNAGANGSVPIARFL